MARAEAPLPIDEHTNLDQRLDWRFLDLRRPSQHLVFDVQTTVEHAMRCFRYGCPPHGGLGLGLTRLLMIMLGLTTIREATFLFRGPNRLEP